MPMEEVVTFTPLTIGHAGNSSKGERSVFKDHCAQSCTKTTTSRGHRRERATPTTTGSCLLKNLRCNRIGKYVSLYFMYFVRHLFAILHLCTIEF